MFKYNYYKMIGLPEFAAVEDVRRVYKKLALTHHPDRGGKSDFMARINDAYDVLTKHKDEYDAWLRMQLGMPNQAIIDLLKEIFGAEGAEQFRRASDFGRQGFTVKQAYYSWTMDTTGQTTNL